MSRQIREEVQEVLLLLLEKRVDTWYFSLPAPTVEIRGDLGIWRARLGWIS